jgi:ubiquitin-conjugating enzyme E2 O
LTRLYDGLDQLEDMFDEGFSEEGSLMEDVFPGGDEWLDGHEAGNGSFPFPPGYANELMGLDWGGDMSIVDVDPSASAGGEEEIMISDAMDTYIDFPGGLPMDDTSITPLLSTTPVPYDPSPPTSQPNGPLRDSENDDIYWKRFDVLSTAPADHAFYDRPVAQPSRSFMARLHKEYRALSTGLPGRGIFISMMNSDAHLSSASILVRGYEDRGDLLRSLIIGPENTPYEDAPFVIDWMLDADFPQTPPIAFFISWTNGNGRVNP